VLTQTASDFVGLALDEEVDTVMLIGQFIKELVLELPQGSVGLTGNRNRLPLVSGRIYLDQVLEFVVIDIV
jgi:hypothetical protein